MTEIFELRSIPMLAASCLDLSRYLLSIKEKEFTVNLADGPLVMKAKWLMVNIFLWRPLLRLEMPVELRHTHHKGLVTPRSIAAMQTEIYTDVISNSTFSDPDRKSPQIRALLHDFCESINDLHTMIVTQLGAYHLSISAFELADLLLQPEIAAMCEIDVEQEQKIGVSAVEKKLEKQGLAIMERLKDRSIPGNVLAPFIELGQLNSRQLPSVLYALGYRTDSDDQMVRRPILTSYVKGMRDIMDYATEALMAKKTIYYSKNAMPDSQYSNRKQQLLSCVVMHLYHGDCGSQVTVPFHVNLNNCHNILHKNIIDKGQMIRLTKQNIQSYVGHVVHFRSSLTCRHTNGVCHACGGYLTHFMPENSVIGVACTIEYSSTASQLVLSAKHFSATRAITYEIPTELKDILVVRQNDVYIRSDVDASRLRIGISTHDIPNINELQHVDTDEEEGAMPISEQQFSTIRSITIHDSDTDLPLTPKTSMVVDDTIPYFSAEFLSFLKDNYKNITTNGDVVWISLKNFDYITEPLFRCVVLSNSMFSFNKKLTQFATSTIRQYTSLSSALQDFSNIVYEEIQTNIFHLETVLKSYLITDDINYDIPIVEDVDNVKFGTLFSLMPRRSLGAIYAFEQLADYMKNPEWYILPHKHGLFDTFFYPSEEKNEVESTY